jgi:hypothetical protein
MQSLHGRNHALLGTRFTNATNLCAYIGQRCYLLSLLHPLCQPEAIREHSHHVVACEVALASQGEAALPGAAAEFGIRTLPLVIGEIIGSVWLAAVGEEVDFFL